MDPAYRAKAEAFFRIDNRKLVADDSLNRYVIWQIVVALGLLMAMAFAEKFLNGYEKLCVLLLLLLTLINCGAILEQKTWIGYLEVSRLLILVVWTLGWYPHWSLLVIVFTAAAILGYHRRAVKYHYLRLVYKRFKPFSF